MIVYLLVEQPTFTGCRIDPHIAYQESICWLWNSNQSPDFHADLYLTFFIGRIMWLYQTQKFIIIFTRVTDVT